MINMRRVLLERRPASQLHVGSVIAKPPRTQPPIKPHTAGVLFFFSVSSVLCLVWGEVEGGGDGCITKSKWRIKPSRGGFGEGFITGWEGFPNVQRVGDWLVLSAENTDDAKLQCNC